jgi:hypothetical protein
MTALVLITRETILESLLTFLKPLFDIRNLHVDEGGRDRYLHLPSILLLKVLISESLEVARKYFVLERGPVADGGLSSAH